MERLFFLDRLQAHHRRSSDVPINRICSPFWLLLLPLAAIVIRFSRHHELRFVLVDFDLLRGAHLLVLLVNFHDELAIFEELMMLLEISPFLLLIHQLLDISFLFQLIHLLIVCINVRAEFFIILAARIVILEGEVYNSAAYDVGIGL